MTKCVFWPALLESERLNVRNSTTSAILRCSDFCALHDQLASLGRHAPLTRCFSAVSELLVSITIPFRAIHFLIAIIIKRVFDWI